MPMPVSFDPCDEAPRWSSGNSRSGYPEPTTTYLANSAQSAAMGPRTGAPRRAGATGTPRGAWGNDVFLHALRSGAGGSPENPREHSMFNRRALLSLLASIGILIGGGNAVAKNQHHNNGHNLLGAKLNQTGKHEIGKAGNATVTAEVNNKKVVNMSAGNLPVRKVKSTKKMAELGKIELVANGEFRLAQAVETYYYGYCFDAGLDVYCYWYPAADVIVTDTWVVYTPL